MDYVTRMKSEPAENTTFARMPRLAALLTPGEMSEQRRSDYMYVTVLFKRCSYSTGPRMTQISHYFFVKTLSRKHHYNDLKSITIALCCAEMCNFYKAACSNLCKLFTLSNLQRKALAKTSHCLGGVPHTRL
jgi:hypothetical protein